MVIICTGLEHFCLVCDSSGGLRYYSLLVTLSAYHLYLCDCIVYGEDTILEEIYGYLILIGYHEFGYSL